MTEPIKDGGLEVEGGGNHRTGFAASSEQQLQPYSSNFFRFLFHQQGAETAQEMQQIKGCEARERRGAGGLLTIDFCFVAASMILESLVHSSNAANNQKKLAKSFGELKIVISATFHWNAANKAIDTSRRQTTNAQVLEESEDDAKAQSPAPFRNAAFRATAQCTDAGTSGVIPDSLYLDLTKALVDTDKNPYDASGMDVARIGLGAPPRPPLVGETPRPSGSGMEHGTEHSMQEVVGRNQAIEALKKEMGILEVEKTRLAGEVGGLCTAQAELGELQKKVDLLNKEVDGAKAAEHLATERTLKAIETANNLRKQEAQKVEAARGAAGAQPSRAAQAMAMKAPSPAVEAMAPRAPSPAVDVPRPREPTPAPADSEV
ncbi:unnamed protein product [Miscanthus lutarioriparius]|uniref:Uncharacterized protein n=1 Tax=Miscanthus lutarioriparius TaxID=422564 RepID=A0A811N6J9_9POAL|nr:unnamed protein product [Miscanthus lutarioriparius]